ncbi:endonuclease/exonuclease/phosphatase family protein [Rubritalea marina]|uniref:endonuclease/exonuclease/phosphatase family protein n=1 Tax=Rubritalea marina TaxID=361055 RepID=UPI000374962E|nr:endonuclease/exonuclease/phosphatase family protein [Rubritalea marina]
MTLQKTPQALCCGVFCFLALCFSSCEKKARETANWPTGQSTPDHQALTEPSINKERNRTQTPIGKETTLLAYNVYNYLWMQRGSKSDGLQAKPEREIRDLIKHITKIKPDILGMCEIGTQADLDDLSRRLSAKQLDYPYQYLHHGVDPYRRLALLSKHPFTVHSNTLTSFKMDGRKYEMLRGMLDVTMNINGSPVRLIGIHLKSQRKSKHYDQERFRRHEAHMVREHVLMALKTNKDLILYGDFNDHLNSASIRAIAGKAHSQHYLKALELSDDDGNRWTHYWRHQDLYSRLDYALASPSMLQRINKTDSKIERPHQWSRASDHHPLLIKFR